MALTVAIRSRDKSGRRFTVTADVTFDNSYAAGGKALTPQTLGLSVIERLNAESAGGYQFLYDRSAQKLKAYQFDYAAAAAGPAVEVAANTDLSAVTTRVAAVGW